MQFVTLQRKMLYKYSSSLQMRLIKNQEKAKPKVEKGWKAFAQGCLHVEETRHCHEDMSKKVYGYLEIILQVDSSF